MESEFDKKYECKHCHRFKTKKHFHVAEKKDGIVSWCKRCRSNRYYEQRYLTICMRCQLPRPIRSNQLCVSCNEKGGLRECRNCKILLPIDLQFHFLRKTCIECRKQKRKIKNQTKTQPLIHST